jgi:DDE superfamily endonuclease
LTKLTYLFQGKVNELSLKMDAAEKNFPDNIIQPINNKPEGKLENCPLAALCTVQKNAYMDTDTMLLWLERVYRPWTVTINGPNIIIMDTFAAHKTDVFVDYITDYQGHFIMIPGGYTSKLQVIDLCINKPLKDSLRDAYNEWFMNINIRTAKLKRTDIAQWVVNTSYDDITTKMIFNAWKKVGLPITKVGDIELDASIYDIDDSYDEEAEQQFAEDDDKDELS